MKKDTWSSITKNMPENSLDKHLFEVLSKDFFPLRYSLEAKPIQENKRARNKINSTHSNHLWSQPKDNTPTFPFHALPKP
jgi:hypothetical protein